MRSSVLALVASAPFFLSAAAGQKGPPASSSEDITKTDSAAEIVVTARKGAAPAQHDAVGFFQLHCFDGIRLNGRPTEPAADSAWDVLDSQARQQFGLTDAAVPAYGLVDAQQGHSLAMKFERFQHKNGISERRCTLAVIGGHDHERLVGQLSALFRGNGTQRHVGHRDGVAPIEGWKQWRWTAIPSRSASNWQGSNAQRRGIGNDSWVVVTTPAFYDANDYVVTDLQTRMGSGSPLSVISLALFTRQDRSQC